MGFRSPLGMAAEAGRKGPKTEALKAAEIVEGEALRIRIRRACITATILCTLLVPAVGSIAADSDDLSEVAEQLQDIRDRIEAHENEAGSLKDQIDNINEDLVDLQIAIANLNDDIEEVQAKAQVAQTQIDETQKQINGVKELAIEQAVSLYKGGTTETIDALLSSGSLSELNDRVQMLGIAAQENTGALIKYGRLKVTLQDQSAELFAIQEDLNNRLAAREEFEAELEDSKANLQVKLVELNEQLGIEREKEDKTQEEYDDIRAQILAAQSAATGGTTPVGPPPDTGSPSASGFIWPINGGVTSPFGPRWGRMHEGIDIDGYSGQPIVASKSGRVISAGDAGDGYGTKVVIDHGGGYTTLYAHQSRLGTSVGASVSQGQVIGYVGCTGSCTGDHLHFEVRINGAPQNPLSYLP
ncbi:MAG: peptidoglycan DD-metalloendopeptidase family protein [Actinomycetota bacterium]|nr:peptidoglycan DD-metalloendopeptidase family protein [Actinomycetota bacterium]